MMHFGTDGIRAKSERFTPEELTAFCLGVLSLPSCTKIAIGRDTRPSGVAIEKTLSAILSFFGAEVCVLGCLPSPALSFCVRALGCDYGIMITASHNPPDDNGLKLFSSSGAKLSRASELVVEKGMRDKPFFPYGRGEIRYYDGSGLYLSHAKVAFPRLDGKKLLLDCACGAASDVAARLFRDLGATVATICDERAGDKINVGCGATHPERARAFTKDYDFVFSFDGDADRVVGFRKELWYDGDRILYLFALRALSHEEQVYGVCGTILTNSAYQTAFSDLCVPFYRADVGDRNVYEKMIKTGARFGAETSGHAIDRTFSPTGDGLLTAALVASSHEEIVRQSERVVPFPTASEEIVLTEDEIASARKAVPTPKIFSFGDVRCVVRVSGTENKVRVLCEGPREALPDGLRFAVQTAKEYL